MIDLARIRSFGGGQRQSFEELVCQLARRDPARAGCGEFRRVEGSGGDGGVECYWLLPDGVKVGYQAKYFTRTGDIDWGQIDKSVKQAFATHPTLCEYVVALACDLTDRRGAQSQGKTGWEIWDDRIATWRSRHDLDANVVFTPWTASDINDRLLPQPSTIGLREYWFGELELSDDWLRAKTARAIKALGERYQPDDHVDVGMSRLFEYLARSQVARSELRTALLEIGKSDWPEREAGIVADDNIASSMASVQEGLGWLGSIEAELDAQSYQTWNRAEWLSCLEEVETRFGDLRTACRDCLPIDQESNRRRADAHARLRHDLSQFLGKVEKFGSLVHDEFLQAEQDRFAFVVGRAGVGKSHLLASTVERFREAGHPVLFLLGQNFHLGPPWPQIQSMLDLNSFSTDQLLGALNAVAEALGRRALIVVDAINEGAGRNVWRGEIASFVADITKYPNLACVVSCRTEFFEFLVPDDVAAKYSRFEVRGFETPQEEAAAAAAYMDNRGIARPCIPWLAPKFTNPLFLKTICNALQKEGKHELPKGLAGTLKIFAAYINSVGRHLGGELDGIDLRVPCRQALSQIAKAMADQKNDFVYRAACCELINSAFSSFQPPNDATWLDVLARNGLLRIDPDPMADSGDPFGAGEGVIRFGFQRFQDHLIAKELLDQVHDIATAFENAGPLSLVLEGQNFAWQWSGLLAALAIQLPERFQRELVDVLPGPHEQWWLHWQVQDAFVESVRWRSPQAFSERSRELLNQLDNADTDTLNLLIEISASIDHPWNAKLIHRNLVAKAMPERDAFWTLGINQIGYEEGGPIHRLIHWALFGQSSYVEFETQKLCGLVLTWCTASSNRFVRDNAVKGLTALFVARADVYEFLGEKFRDVDDPYVIEGLLAAAYGSCCIDPQPTRLKSYATKIYAHLFETGTPPLGLLIRDYALGIIERHIHSAGLNDEIDLSRCQPPYGSLPPEFNIDEQYLRELADRAGGSAILRSCTGFIGDFGHYEINPRMSSFTLAPISEPAPMTMTQRHSEFFASCIAPYPERCDAFEQLEELRRREPLINIFFAGEGDDAANLSREQFEQDILAATDALMELLTPQEQDAYQRDGNPYARHEDHTEFGRELAIDIDAACRWVAEKAYGLGWTRTAFGDEERSYSTLSRERPKLERVGKKYQWIALDELLCRLADNYWMKSSYHDHCTKYGTISDLDFERDIEPTILPLSSGGLNSQGSRPAWVTENMRFQLEEVTDIDLHQWPFLVERADELGSLISTEDASGGKWLTLYEHQSWMDQYDERRPMEHPLRHREFRFLLCVIVRRAGVLKLVEYLSDKADLDVQNWDPHDVIDGPFVREADWRQTWPQEMWQQDNWHAPEGLEFAIPVQHYVWEGQLDASLPEGASAYVPSSWLSKALDLHPRSADASCYVDRAGQDAFWGTITDRQSFSGQSSAFIKADLFEGYLKNNDLTPIWLFVGEREAWPGGGNANAVWRRSEGVCWFDGKTPKIETWRKDNER